MRLLKDLSELTDGDFMYFRSWICTCKNNTLHSCLAHTSYPSNIKFAGKKWQKENYKWQYSIKHAKTWESFKKYYKLNKKEKQKILAYLI